MSAGRAAVTPAAGNADPTAGGTPAVVPAGKADQAPPKPEAPKEIPAELMPLVDAKITDAVNRRLAAKDAEIAEQKRTADLTAEQKRTEAETRATEATTKANRAERIAELAILAGGRVPPDAIKTAVLDHSGDWDAAAVLTALEAKTTAWLAANGYAKTGAPPTPSGPGAVPPNGTPPANAAGDFANMTHEQKLEKARTDPEFRKRYYKDSEEKRRAALRGS